MDAVVHLLLCPVYLPVKDRKDVLIAVGLFRRVFGDDLTGLGRERAGQLFPGLMACIIHSGAFYIALPQRGDVLEIDSCGKVGE